MANRWWNSGNNGWLYFFGLQKWLYFFGLQNHCRWWWQPWNLKMITPWKESYDQPRQHIKKQRHYFVNKGLSSHGYGFSSSHVWMWELDYKERIFEPWMLKSWCFWTVVLEKTLESPFDGKAIQPVHPKGNQPWIFIGRTDVKAETPILWPPDVKSWLIWKDPELGKIEHLQWDGWMASPTPWTWVWVNYGSWWWTGRPRMLQFMASQRVGHDWVTELNWYAAVGSSQGEDQLRIRSLFPINVERPHFLCISWKIKASYNKCNHIVIYSWVSEFAFLNVVHWFAL